MIAYIEGKLVYCEPTYAVLDVGGLGYQVRISLNTYTALRGKQKCRLHTHLQIREDAHTLYGFAEANEKKYFLQLVSVSGIGANTALMILSSLSPEELLEAIIGEDVQVIKQIKGIGAKTAQRLILELKDKINKGNESIPKLAQGAETNLASQKKQIRLDALQALVELGLNKNVAERKIEQILKQTNSEELQLENVIKQALKN